MSTAWHWHVPDLISQDEENELAARSVKGDGEARALLVMSNLRFVLSMAASFSQFPTERQDLIGEGLRGAWEAAIKYDPSHGVKFCTYASWWIRSYMIRHLKVSTRLLTNAPNMFKLNKELARSHLITGRGLEDESVLKDIAGRLDMTPRQVLNKWNSSVRKLLLDAPCAEGEGHPLSDVIPSESDPEKESVKNELSRISHDAVKLALSRSGLTDREVYVVKMAVMGDSTFSEVGAGLGVSKQRAKQICDIAVKKMRTSLGRSNFHDCFA